MADGGRRGSRMWRRVAAWVLSATMVVAGISGAAVSASAAPAASSSEAVASSVVKTADLSKFQPGNIISDAAFFSAGTMSEAQIQSFMQSKVPTCQSGYVCLKDWYDTSRTTSADAMCNAYSGGVRERASTIIYKVAQACGINPQVLLVMLQKEQGLVTHTWPSDWRYTKAMGQGCPDTAGCDARYSGFFNQVYGAAWQMKRYANPPGTSAYFTWFAPGKTWNVRWHPSEGCGSSPVYIQNQATANLYYYTPYQPNAAAIRAGYGEGDGCSSYGNRNFYQYFTDWFGSTQEAVLQVLQVTGTSERYLVSQGARWRLATAEIAAQFTWISSVRDVSRTVIDTYQDRGSAKRAIRTDRGAVYLLDSGARFRVGDLGRVNDFGWDYTALPVASEAQVAAYRDGGWLERTVRSDNRNWLIQGSTRREVADLGVLPRFGILAVTSPASPAMLAEYSVSSPVVAAGVYKDANNSYRVVTDAGSFLLPDAAKGTGWARNARDLASESISLLKADSALPLRVSAGGKSYVMADGGWLEIARADYPSALTFTDLPVGATSGISSAGRSGGPHFVREKSDTQAYLVSNGTMQAVSTADQAWITANYGVNPQVWVVLDGTVTDVAAPEGFVRTGSGAAYLLDGTRAYRFRDCGQVAAWGADCANLSSITDAKLAGYASAGTLQHLVRTPAGTTWLAQQGQLRQVLDPGILAVYGITSSTSAVSAATAAKLPVGEPVLAAGIYSDGGGARAAVTESGEYTLTADQSVGVVKTTARALTQASFARISFEGSLPSRMRSDDRSFILTQEGWLEVSAATYGGDSVFTQLPTRAWTGIPVAGAVGGPHFVRDDSAGTEYLVSAGIQIVSDGSERARITSTYGVPPKVWPLVGGALLGIQVNYDLFVKSTADEVFLIDGGNRYRTNGCAVVTDFGKNCATVRTLSSAQLAATRDGGNLAALLRSPDGFVWLPQAGVKREVPDPRILSAYGIGTVSTGLTAQVFAQLRLGQPVVGSGVFDDRAGDVRAVTGDGRTFGVPQSSRLDGVMSGAWTMSPASIDLLASEGDLPTRITDGSQKYVLTSEGWLAVSGENYGPLTFVDLGRRGSEGIRFAASQMGPHFIREQTASQIYLASGGLTPVADEAARAWIASTYGVPGKLWVAADGALR